VDIPYENAENNGVSARALLQLHRRMKLRQPRHPKANFRWPLGHLTPHRQPRPHPLPLLSPTKRTRNAASFTSSPPYCGTASP